MKKMLLIMALSLSFIYAGGFQFGKGNGGQGQGQSPTVELTEVQKATILYIYQEEKVARDVYITFGNLYPKQKTFKSIQKSEQNHMDAVKKLCIKYDIDISGINEGAVGDFVLPELQELYDIYIELGSKTELESLYVAETIEIIDIQDLEDASIGMPSDVQRTFFRLKKGAENHLRRFRSAIAKLI